eukprot:gene1979-2014_t
MSYLSETEPQRGVALPAAEGIRRIVAGNPGPMTYHGTNTYLLDGPDGVSVLDPGPDDAAHLAAVLREAGTVARILVSHGHSDHVDGLAAMRAATGAPVFAFDAALAPDQLLVDGAVDRLYLPGHGPAITDPKGYARFLLAHREQREAAILAALDASGRDVPALRRICIAPRSAT